MYRIISLKLYLSTDEEFQRKGSEHIQPKAEAGDIDQGVMLLGVREYRHFNCMFTDRREVVQDVALGFVGEDGVRRDRQCRTCDK